MHNSLCTHITSCHASLILLLNQSRRHTAGGQRTSCILCVCVDRPFKHKARLSEELKW